MYCGCTEVSYIYECIGWGQGIELFMLDAWCNFLLVYKSINIMTCCKVQHLYKSRQAILCSVYLLLFSVNESLKKKGRKKKKNKFENWCDAVAFRLWLCVFDCRSCVSVCICMCVCVCVCVKHWSNVSVWWSSTQAVSTPTWYTDIEMLMAYCKHAYLHATGLGSSPSPATLVSVEWYYLATPLHPA